MNKKLELYSFDEILDKKYGKDGAESREQFEREAEAYCVGKLISDGRKRGKMTQSELASQVGVSKSYISRIENGAV